MANSEQSDFLSVEELQNVLEKIDVGNPFKLSNDEFFKDCNKFFRQYEKKGVLSDEDEYFFHKGEECTCKFEGCNAIFKTIYEYDVHYKTLHKHYCAECSKSFSSEHHLDLHLSETHDSFFAIQAKQKPMYLCYFNDCEQKFWTPEERKLHCNSDHKIPAEFLSDSTRDNNGVQLKKLISEYVESRTKEYLNENS